MMKENELNPDEKRELEENIRELRGENHTQVEKNRQLLLQVSQLQRETESETQRLQTIQKDVAGKEGHIRQLQENIRELRGENHTQAEKNRQLLLQVSQLQREKGSEMQRLQKMQKDVVGKGGHIRQLEENIRELRGENHTQVEKNRQLSLQVSQLQREKGSEIQRLQENIRELRGEKHTQADKNRQLSLQVSQLQREKDREIQRLQTIQRDLEEKDSCIRQLQKRLSDEKKVKEELHEESLMNKQIIEQYRADFEAERKDRQEAAGKFADREKEWMEQIRRIEEERDHLQKHLGYRHDERLRQESQTLRDERQHLRQTTQELQATQDTCKKLCAEKKHLEYQLAMNGEALHTESQHNERLKRENQTLRAEVKDTRQCSLQKIQDLQEQMEKQKMEINWLKLELSNRQQDARKSKSRYTSYTHIYDRNEQEHSATSMKTERTTSQRIQKLEEENQTLEYQVKYTGQALQEKENLCKELQKHVSNLFVENEDLRSILKRKNTWAGWVGTLFGSS